MKNKRVLALLGVFLLSANVLIPATNKIKLNANDIDTSGINYNTYQDVVDIDFLNVFSTGCAAAIDDFSALYGFTGYAYERDNNLAYNSMEYCYLGENVSINAYLNIYQRFNFNAGSLFTGDNITYYPYSTIYNLNPSTSSDYTEITFIGNDFVIPVGSVRYLQNSILTQLFNIDTGNYSSNNYDFSTDFNLNIINFYMSCDINYYIQSTEQLSVYHYENNIPSYNSIGTLEAFHDMTRLVNNLDLSLKNNLMISNFKLTIMFGYTGSSYIRVRSLLINTNDNPTYETLLNGLIFYVPSLEQADFSSWLVEGIGGFLSFELIPGISLTTLLAVILAIPLLIAFLKIFAGG